MTAADDWAAAQRAQHLSNRTVDARLLTVRRLGIFTGKDPAEASSSEVTDFLASLDIGRSAAATYHAHLRAWFRWLALNDRRVDNPMLRVIGAKAPKRYPRPVTDRELEAILSTRMHRRTRMMILLGAYEGLRVSEIARVRGEDVNLLDSLLRVAGKGESDVELPLHPAVAAEAGRYPRKGWWFPSYTRPGRAIRGQSVTQVVGNVFERAGVDGGAHRLRHWYGTRLLDGGANMRVVQQLLRHSYIQTTQVYTQVSFAQQREAIDALVTRAG